MSWNFNDLIPHINMGATELSTSLLGFIPSVRINGALTMAAKGDIIEMVDYGTETVKDGGPTTIITDADNHNVPDKKMSLTKHRVSDLVIKGEDDLKMTRTGIKGTILSNRITEKMRAITDEMEADLAVAAYQNASRIVGEPGVTPFETAPTAANLVRAALSANGTPRGDWSLVLNSDAIYNLGELTQLTDASAAADTEFFRQGVLKPIHQMNIKESHFVQTHVAGTGLNYDVTVAGALKGDRTLTVEGGDSGTILTGDGVKFGTDPNIYVVQAGNTASGSAGGIIPVGRPGFLLPKTDIDEMVIQGNYVANVGFKREAIQLAVRLPAIPTFDGKMGDSAIWRYQMQEPRSGITFLFALYPQVEQLVLRIGAVWGVGIQNEGHIVALAG